MSEWAMWKPRGCCMGSQGADKIGGWQIKKGLHQVLDYVDAEPQPRRRRSRPAAMA
jgi:hypothetical protein